LKGKEKEKENSRAIVNNSSEVRIEKNTAIVLTSLATNILLVTFTSNIQTNGKDSKLNKFY
jgi:hypothetical protein